MSIDNETEELSFDEISEFMEKAGSTARDKLLVELLSDLLNAVRELQGRVDGLSTQIAGSGHQKLIGGTTYPPYTTSPQVTWTVNNASDTIENAKLAFNSLVATYIAEAK